MKTKIETKRKTKKKNKSHTAAKSPSEIAKAFGIESEVDISLIQIKAQLSEMAEKSIAVSGLSVNEIVERAGVARSKVSAIKNGALSGISCDLFLKVIAASGGKVSLKLAV